MALFGVGLAPVEAIALCVFLCQMAFSVFWLRFFRFGPLEWIWRMLVYNRWPALLRDS